MERLRARHWFAVTLALILIVVAYSAEVTVVDEAGILATAARAGDQPADQASGQPSQTPAGPTLAAADQAAAGSTTTPSTEYVRPEPPVPLAPYTGLPAEPGTAERPALFIKIDNHARARPQTALDQADIVFDMRAEVVNRFAAVFQSTIPNPVGPVRSSRTSDFDILRGFDTPIYGSSGGNQIVLAGLKRLPIVELTAWTRTEYFRDRSRRAPHNLFIDGHDLYDLAPDDLPVPTPWFEYRTEDEPLLPSANPVSGPVAVDFTGDSFVTHEWNGAIGGWLRTQDGKPHLTSEGIQLAPENVVIFTTSYVTSPADPISPEVRSTGEGPLVVLTDGHAIVGTWSRPRPEDKPSLTDQTGEVIRLTPGRTWVLMPEPGQVTFPEGISASRGRNP